MLETNSDTLEDHSQSLHTMEAKLAELYLSRGKLLCNSYNTKWEEENRESRDNINKIKKSKIKIK